MENSMWNGEQINLFILAHIEQYPQNSVLIKIEIRLTCEKINIFNNIGEKVDFYIDPVDPSQ